MITNIDRHMSWSTNKVLTGANTVYAFICVQPSQLFSLYSKLGDHEPGVLAWYAGKCVTSKNCHRKLPCVFFAAWYIFNYYVIIWKKV